MNYRLTGLFGIAILAMAFTACGETANTNVNTNANVAVTNQNTNANATATARKGSREEYEKNKQSYSEQAKGVGSKIGSGLNDGWLWTKTRFDLAAADDLRDSTINVDVDNDVVTLKGTVATAEQKKRAEEVAKAVEGVKSVKNMITVAPNTSANANSKGTPPGKK